MPVSIEHPKKWERGKLLCFSHLRWNFVFQRPQHLLTRFARQLDVIFFEEPVFGSRSEPHLDMHFDDSGVRIVTPLLPSGATPLSNIKAQRMLLDWLLQAEGVSNFTAWYYTPMALGFSRHLHPSLTVYDCMDELSAFQEAPAELVELEQELFSRADVVFAGGQSLYEAKRRQHSNVHGFPSSIDYAHFSAARELQDEPVDQQAIPHPRIGFFGVLDERLDRDLLSKVAAAHPEWHFVFIGPVVKISNDDLPVANNIHYLGQKSYSVLPSYIASWQVAMLPFAQNAATRFISPTKTPEYLAAGKPVVSTPIRDVVNPYGSLGLVSIASTADEFAACIARALDGQPTGWLKEVDLLLSRTSWDRTFQAMQQVMQDNRAQKLPAISIAEPEKRVANL